MNVNLDSFLFSIIIPAYNSSETIIESIESIFKNRCTDFEIIVINDGSNDDTLIKLESSFQKLDNLTIINIENKGVSNARNTGILKAEGDFIIFLDSDDQLLPNSLDNIEAIIKKSKTEYHFIVSKTLSKLLDYKFCKDNDFFYKNIHELMLPLEMGDAFGYLHGKCYNRRILISNNVLFDTSKDMSEDLFFNLQFIKHIDNVYYINKNTYNYVQNASSALGTKYYYCLDDRIESLFKYIICSLKFSESNIQKDFIIMLYIRIIKLVYDSLNKNNQGGIYSKEIFIKNSSVLVSSLKLKSLRFLLLVDFKTLTKLIIYFFNRG